MKVFDVDVFKHCWGLHIYSPKYVRLAGLITTNVSWSHLDPTLAEHVIQVLQKFL